MGEEYSESNISDERAGAEFIIILLLKGGIDIEAFPAFDQEDLLDIGLECDFVLFGPLDNRRALGVEPGFDELLGSRKPRLRPGLHHKQESIAREFLCHLHFRLIWTQLWRPD